MDKKEEIDTPGIIANIYISALKVEAEHYDEIIKLFKGVVELGRQKVETDSKYIKDELTYLNIFMINQAIIKKYPMSSTEIDKCLLEGLETFIRKKTSDEFVSKSTGEIVSAIESYKKRYSKLKLSSQTALSEKPITHPKDIPRDLAKFARYILIRMFRSKKIRKNMPCIYFLIRYYNDRMNRYSGLVDKTCGYFLEGFIKSWLS